MKKIVIILCLLTLLPALSGAQYVQPVNAPIYSANKTRTPYGIINYAGTALAADSAIMIMPDSTFSRTAKKIAWGSVNDFWNPPLFKLATLSRPLPVDFEMRVTTAGDSLIVTDRREPSTNIVFVAGANNLIGGATISSIDQRNGRIVIGTGSGVVVYDWKENVALKYSTSGMSEYVGTDDYASRNAGNGWAVLNSAPAIVNNTVNAVSIIGDPLGATEPGTGRPSARVGVSTAGGVSWGDAGIVNIYDSADAGNSRILSSVPDGDFFHILSGTRDLICWSDRVQTIKADSYLDYNQGIWGNTRTGSEKIPWIDAAISTGLVSMPYASVSESSSPVVIFGSDKGVVISHSKRNDNTNGLTFSIDATRNSPPWSGPTVGRSYSLSDTIEAFGNNLKRSNGAIAFGKTAPGTAALFSGSTGVMTDTTHLGDYPIGTGGFALSFSCSTSATAAATQYVILSKTAPNQTTNNVTINLTSTTSYLSTTIQDSNGTDKTINSAIAIDDSRWHHVALSSTGVIAYLYLDGEVIGSIALTGLAINPNKLYVGSFFDGTNRLTGGMADLSIYKRALSQGEVRWLYQRMLHRIQSTIDQRDGLDTAYVAGVTVDPVSNRWFATWGSGNGLRDSVTVWDEYGIPWRRYGSPGGNIQTVAIRSTPGTDSLSVCIGTTTKTKWLQSDPKISDLASNYRPTYPDHEGWAQHVSTPRDSGTWAEGSITFSSADSLGKFTNATATNGILRVGKNAEIRGTLWVRTSTTPSADIAEMFATPAANMRFGLKAITSDRTEFFAPAFLRASSIMVTDNDSTRTYSAKVEKANDTDMARIFMNVARVGTKDATTSGIVYVSGVEVGDSLKYRVDSTTVATVVTSVKGDTVTLASVIPEKVSFRILPPSLLVKYTGSVIQAGDVVQMAAGKTMRLSTLPGRRGWIVSTSPGQILGTGKEGVPVALVGTTPCAVSADSGAVAVGDALTAGTNGVAVKAKIWLDAILGYAQESVATGVKRISVLVAP